MLSSFTARPCPTMPDLPATHRPPDVFRRLRRGNRAARAGFTILEAGVAGAIVTLFLASLFALNSDMMHLLRAAAEAANASQDLQQRVEQVRLSNWTQLTDPTWVEGNLLNLKTDASVNLPGLTETLTVTPYTSPSSTPAASPPPPFTVTRNSDSTLVVNPAGYAYSSVLAQQEMVRIDLSVTWPSLYRTRTRSLTTLVSQWGISK